MIPEVVEMRFAVIFVSLLQNFNFDVKLVHWNTYLENYCVGTKVFALKEDLANMPEARKHVQRYVKYSTK